MVAGCSLKSSRASSVMAMSTRYGSLVLDLVLVEGVSIGCVSVEGKGIGLVCVVALWMSLLTPSCFEGCGVGGWAFKPGWVGPKLGIAGTRPLHFYFVGYVALFVLSLIVKFGSVRLVGIPRLVLGWLGGLSLVVFTIGRLQKTRVVVTLIERVPAFLASFHFNIVGLVELVVGGISAEWNVLWRTVVLVCV